jgi:hypothetical protein
MPKGHGLGNGAPAREEVPPFWGSSQENVGKTYGILVDSKEPKIGNIWLFGPFFGGILVDSKEQTQMFRKLFCFVGLI